MTGQTIWVGDSIAFQAAKAEGGNQSFSIVGKGISRLDGRDKGLWSKIEKAGQEFGKGDLIIYEIGNNDLYFSQKQDYRETFRKSLHLLSQNGARVLALPPLMHTIKTSRNVEVARMTETYKTIIDEENAKAGYKKFGMLNHYLLDQKLFDDPNLRMKVQYDEKGSPVPDGLHFTTLDGKTGARQFADLIHKHAAGAFEGPAPQVPAPAAPPAAPPPAKPAEAQGRKGYQILSEMKDGLNARTFGKLQKAVIEGKPITHLDTKDFRLFQNYMRETLEAQGTSFTEEEKKKLNDGHNGDVTRATAKQFKTAIETAQKAAIADHKEIEGGADGYLGRKTYPHLLVPQPRGA